MGELRKIMPKMGKTCHFWAQSQHFSKLVHKFFLIFCIKLGLNKHIKVIVLFSRRVFKWGKWGIFFLLICSSYFSETVPHDRYWKVCESYCFGTLRKILIMHKMGRWVVFGLMSIFNEHFSKFFLETLLKLQIMTGIKKWTKVTVLDFQERNYFILKMEEMNQTLLFFFFF